MDTLGDDVASAAAADADPRVRLASLRAGELLVRKKTGPGMTQAAVKLARDPEPEVQLQVLTMASPDLPEIQAAATAVLARHMGEPLFRAAAINGATGRELVMLQTLLTDRSLSGVKNGRKDLLNDLAECVARSRSADRISKLLDLIASQPGGAEAAQEAMLAGVLEAVSPAARGKTSGAVRRRLRLPREPKALSKLTDSAEPKLEDLAKKIEDGLSWPDKPGDTTPPLKPLTAEQERRFAAGRDVFTTVCAQCHQPSGLGQEGTAPPLVDSEWVLGPPERTARIVLHGLHGPIQVGKRTMDLEMPGLKAFDDDQIASVLTYIRREWGHEANPVDPAIVAHVRQQTLKRGDLQWTAEELKKEFPDPEAPKTRPTSRPARRSTTATKPRDTGF
jgi:mono/diheme cytochrome c family protein